MDPQCEVFKVFQSEDAIMSLVADEEDSKMTEIEGKIIWMVGLEHFRNDEVVAGGVGLKFLELLVDVVLDAGVDLSFILTITHI